MLRIKSIFIYVCILKSHMISVSRYSFLEMIENRHESLTCVSSETTRKQMLLNFAQKGNRNIALWLTRECHLILRLTGTLASVLVHFFRFMVYLNYFENMTRVIIAAMNTTWAVKTKPEKNSGLNGSWTHDLCMTSAIPVIFFFG